MDTNTPEWNAEKLVHELVTGSPFFLLDVRSVEQFNRARVDPGRTAVIENVPFNEVPAFVQRGGLPSDKPIVAICNRGHSSARIVEFLRDYNIQAINFLGGMQAWSKHYEVRAVVEEQQLSIYQISRPARGCLSYLVVSNGEALVVDPLRHGDHYLDLCQEKNCKIVGVVDTHGHADHITSGPALAKSLGVPYYLHPEDAVHPFDKAKGPVRFTPLEEGQTLKVGALSCKVLHVPGHTLGNCALLIGSYLIASDTIFLDAVSRPDLGGQSESWSRLHFESLRRLATLPPDTVVLPGHFSSIAGADSNGLFAAKLGQLLKTNPGMKEVALGEPGFLLHIQSAGMSIPPQYVEIKRINIGLKQAGEELAEELETGKNQCALR